MAEAPVVATIAKAKSKKYYHRIPGAKFYMPDGRPLSFSAGDGGFETDVPEIQKELDAIADSASSMVYTKRVVEDMAEGQLRHDVSHSAEVSFDAANKIPAGTETIPIPTAAPAKPVLTPAAARGAETAAGSDLTSKLAAAKTAIAGAGGPVPTK